ncbi:S8 family peptidase [Mediterraneibacter glycyrrhizinilyticus]|uniref:S8 family peptidase n=1 Tax=Mediterraneibacter glycyrrhizinilyticus TaxID=342942 RepID=UPI0025AA889C|nr:S8 family peptidase [Mediterraneibacter glycyrrhizinilyticus]MDN0044001.1 S8 family peptidase [Mediterraneibacter glycyrrhizinilyticus]
MPTDTETCREYILSEDYRDFIGNHVRTSFFDSIMQTGHCEQDVGFGYKCFYLPASSVDPVTLPKFSYNSIPKCYAPVSMETLNQTGILPVQNYPTLQLKGSGVLIGFLDSGIDYSNTIFRNLDGSTRIAAIWDQTVQNGTPPQAFSYGSEFTREQINEALLSENPLEIVPSTDDTGHGTYAASLAAGGADVGEQFLGAAPEASIAVVKLKQAKQYLRNYYYIPDNTVCYQETDIMLGLKFLNDLADSLEMPLVVCITCGTTMGGHIGTLPLSFLIDGYSTIANHITVIGTGNEADKRHHYFNTIENERDTKTVEIRVGENVSGFSMELWTEVPNILSISIISPSGENTSRIPFRVGASAEIDFLFERTKVAVDYRLLVEKSSSELVFFRFNAPAPGIWKIIVEPLSIADGRFHIWLPMTEFLSGEVFFLESDPYYTLTNPANVDSPVVVSYYDGNTGAVSQTSGRGYTRTNRMKPDITAPGVNVTGAVSGGRFSSRSGSCISAAITAGAVALMLEWLLDIQEVPGIDSFQIKSLLILGAVRPKTMEYPNREWGYGQLNLYNTFEAMRQL